MFLKSKNYRKSYLKSILFILPGVVLTVAFVIYPVVNTAWLSLNNWNGIGGAPVTWVGLENYIKVLTSDKFWKSMLNAFVFYDWRILHPDADCFWYGSSCNIQVERN